MVLQVPLFFDVLLNAVLGVIVNSLCGAVLILYGCWCVCYFISNIYK